MALSFPENLQDAHRVQNRDRGKLKEYGGPEGVVRILSSHPANGLDLASSGPASLEGRQETFGANRFPARKGKNLFVLIWEQLKDPTLILLMAAAMVSLHSSKMQANLNGHSVSTTCKTV